MFKELKGFKEFNALKNPPLSYRGSSPTNRRPKREQRLLANYAPQVGGKATEGGLKGRLGGVVEIALGVPAEQGGCCAAAGEVCKRAVDANRPPSVVVARRSFETPVFPLTPVTPVIPVTPARKTGKTGRTGRTGKTSPHKKLAGILFDTREQDENVHFAEKNG